MPTLPSRRPRPLWWAVAVAVLLAGGGGWWLGHSRPASRSDDPKRSLLVKEVDRLRQRLEREEVSEADRQRLLELLVALGRRKEAISLLEPMADREPARWTLRLMLAELRREEGDRSGAERELRQILSVHPHQVEALQLLALLKLETGRGSEAERQVKASYTARSQPQVSPEALGLGLLLAELQQRRQQPQAAEATYRQLAGFFPQDPRPLLGLALLRHERGDGKGALEALEQARQRNPDPDKSDPQLDALAASWGLAPLRAGAGSRPGPKPQAPQPQGEQPQGQPTESRTP